MLKDILNSKKCFKLICGAGNQNLPQITSLVKIFANAGCCFFDLAADIDVLNAAKKGVKDSCTDIDSIYFCVSVATSADKHLQKALIDPARCINCQKCKNICPQIAIASEAKFCVVDKSKCIGCAKCSFVCPSGAISFEFEEQNITSILPPLVESGIDCVEFHLNGDEGDEIFTKWDEINSCFDGMLSICIGRQKVSDEKMLDIIKKLLSVRKPYATIIQADGLSMSGGVDDYASALAAVSTAEVIQKASFPAFLIISGGTNSKSTELAKQCGVNLDGVAIGSFARKIIKGQDENGAILAAKNLIDVSIEHLG